MSTYNRGVSLPGLDEVAGVPVETVGDDESQGSHGSSVASEVVGPPMAPTVKDLVDLRGGQTPGTDATSPQNFPLSPAHRMLRRHGSSHEMRSDLCVCVCPSCC